MLSAKFGWNWSSDYGEEDENVKLYDNNFDGDKDDGQRTNFDKKNSLEGS